MPKCFWAIVLKSLNFRLIVEILKSVRFPFIFVSLVVFNVDLIGNADTGEGGLRDHFESYELAIS